MSLYELNNKNKLHLINEKSFQLEKDIQSLTELNLEFIFGLECIKSELPINNFRLDTLAFDHNTNAFVILEYKKDKNYSVVDQGFTYLSLLLNNKADFILEYNEVKDERLSKNDVDWSQSRIIFISPSFTNYQKESINFKDLPIELWEIKKYENDTIAFEQIKTSGAVESINTISKVDEQIKKVSKEIKVYTEQEHIDLPPYNRTMF